LTRWGREKCQPLVVKNPGSAGADPQVAVCRENIGAHSTKQLKTLL